MKRLLLAFFATLFVWNCASALDPMAIDFHWNYKRAEAQRLFKRKKYKQAQEEAEKLAKTAPNEAAKVGCLSLAAIALAHQGQYEPALKQAGAFDDKPVSDFTRMEVMLVSGKHADLVAAFKDADLANWPGGLSYKAYHKRGLAHLTLKDFGAAARDFEACVARAAKDTEILIECLNRVGWLREKLKDEDAALASYMKVVEMCSGKPHLRGSHGGLPNAALYAARILVGRDQREEALEVLGRYDTSRSKSYGPRVLEAMGDIHAALGHKFQAVAKYREIIEVVKSQWKGKRRDRYIEKLNKKIEEVSK